MDKSPVDQAKLVISGSKATYEFVDQGPQQGTYRGIFEFNTFLTPMQTVDVDREIRLLIGENPAMVSEDAESLAFALVQLKYRITKAPPFWNNQTSRYAGGDIPDINIINHVFAAAIESEAKYREDLRKRKEQALEGLKRALDRKAEDEKIELKKKEAEQAQ